MVQWYSGVLFLYPIFLITLLISKEIWAIKMLFMSPTCLNSEALEYFTLSQEQPAADKKLIYLNRARNNLSVKSLSDQGKGILSKLINKTLEVNTSSCIEQLKDSTCRDMFEQLHTQLSQADSDILNEAGFEKVSRYSVYENSCATEKIIALASFYFGDNMSLFSAVMDSNASESEKVECSRPGYSEKTQSQTEEGYYHNFRGAKSEALAGLEKQIEKSPNIIKIITQLKQNKFEFTIKQKDKLAVPSDELLIAQARNYKHKYDIDITIATREEVDCFGPSEKANEYLESLLLTKLQDPTPRIEGIIYSENAKIGHAVPIILQMSKTGPFALVCDVLGPDNGTLAYKETLLALKKLKIPFAQAKETRQADFFSCRTGALVTLRNALLDLKKNLLPGQSIFKYSNVAVNKNGKVNTYSIPDQWAFTDQVYKAKINLDPDNPRRHYSSKRKNLEAISKSRERYQNEVEYLFSLEGKAGSKTQFNLESCPVGITITTKPDPYNKSYLQIITIEWKAKLTQNTYMHEKGFSIAQKNRARKV